ncbi:MAG: DUF3488 and transglutaminase-like domain-containing protein [Thermodesulforhabdaceae bacterium]
MLSMKFLLDSVILVLIVLCFGINLSEISMPWFVTGTGVICLDLLLSIRNNTWRLGLPRWLLNILALSVIIATALRLNWDNAVNVLLECFICLTAIKWIERQKVRDYLQILALCLFALVSHAFFTFSMAYLLTIMATMVIATSALVILTGFAELEKQNQLSDAQYNLPLSWLFGFSIVFLLVSFPLSFILFFILPRTETPFIAFLNREQISYSGFSNVVELGSVERIQEDETVAFRAIVQDLPANIPRYWRGLVYDSFDGSSWKSSTVQTLEGKVKDLLPSFAGKSTEVIPYEHTVHQTIIMESSGHKFLFCLDIPVSVKGLAKGRITSIQGERVFIVDRPVDRRVKYECISELKLYEAELTEKEWKHYISIPEGWESEESIRRIVQEIVGSSEDKIEIAWKFINWLKTPPFQYAASGLPLSSTALEDFLLKTRKGNCEYFASALAVMLRMVGIPARLVGGYYGGYYHPLGSYYLVLQKNAHVWVEAFFQSSNDYQGIIRGRWIRLEPTPLPPDLDRRIRLSLWFRIRLALDFVQYSWNRLVIQYDMKEQERIAKKMGERVFHFRKTLSSIKNLNLAKELKVLKEMIIKNQVKIGIIVIVGIFLAVALLKLRSRVYRRNHELLLRDFERHFSRKYAARQPNETLREWFSRIADDLNRVERDRGYAFIDLYERCLYGPQNFREDDIKHLKDLLRF